jgi:cytochrome c oxidase subunit II
VIADEAYVRESITNPHAKLVAGYPPIMPTFQGLISEEGLLQLIAYIKSLSPAASEATTNDAGSPAVGAGAASANAPPKSAPERNIVKP